MACNPVKYDDLGKQAKDLLNKNYHFGVLKVEGKSKSTTGLADFTFDGVHNTDTGNVNGGLESKLYVKDYPVTVTEKWNTDNVITTTFSFDSLLEGLKADFECTIAPTTGKRSAKIKTDYKHELLHGTLDVDVDFAGPVFHGSLVTGYKNLLLGGKASYDTGNSKLASSAMSLGFNMRDFKAHAGIVDFSKYFGSVSHAVADNLSVAAQLAWDQNGGGAPSLTVGGHYNLDKDTFYKVKIDNELRLGMSYVTKLREGIQLTLSGLINAKALNGGGHKFGLSLNLEA